MALVRHKVLRADVRGGEVNLPEKAKLVGLLPAPDPATGLPVLAFIMTHEDWVEAFPDEAKAEKEVEAGAPNVQ